MKAAAIGKAIFEKVSSFKVNKYENVLEEALKDWQKDGSMPENAPKCIQRYIIEDKDKEKFYKAFQAVLKEQIIENNPINIDRLIQIFTQANNAEINQRIVQITTEIIQEDLSSKKSKLKNNEELNKKLLEIVQNNFAEFYKTKDQVEDKNTNNSSAEKKEDKYKVSKNNKADSKNTPFTSAAAYENLIKLFSGKTEIESSTSSTSHKEENKKQSETDQISNFSDKQNDNFQSTQNILEPREKPSEKVETEIVGGQSLATNAGHLQSQD